MTRRRTIATLGIGLAIAATAAIAAAVVARTRDPIVIPITIHYSHFDPATVRVPAGLPITFVITNTDPIDHEWIVGDAATHERHRTGTEPVHDARPTEITIPAGTERRTTVTFAAPGSELFICHLPGHEAYGMVGTVVITP
ncbi:MAG TPA: cupredoxin domain-containing protein [Candidatus Limnocylindrales bacterium]|nr:cupredoxin domain-containing protein [Candidatus Limnocylindrales bacterium]